MNLSELLAQLREPFPPDDHAERDLPGGGKWFFVPWQKIRDRLNELCPDWLVEYDEPKYLDKYCIVKARLTIAGVSREAWGNAEIELLSKSGKDMSRGTPIERAIADAFKNCAESFGIAAYLDEQSADKRNFTIRYLQSKGDGRAVKLARENEWIAGGLPTAQQRQEVREAKAAAEVEQIRQHSAARLISEKQIVRLSAIAGKAGYTIDGLKALLKGYGYTSRKQITASNYEEICEKAGDSALAERFNQVQAEVVA